MAACEDASAICVYSLRISVSTWPTHGRTIASGIPCVSACEINEWRNVCIALGQLRPAMKLALDLMKQGSHQVEMSDEGMMTEDIEARRAVLRLPVTGLERIQLPITQPRKPLAANTPSFKAAMTFSAFSGTRKTSMSPFSNDDRQRPTQPFFALIIGSSRNSVGKDGACRSGRRWLGENRRGCRSRGPCT